MKKELNYMDSVHRYGRIWGIIVAVALLSFPLILSLVFKTAPDFGVLLAGVFATAPMYWAVGIVEIFTYVPMLGAGGSYLSFVTGNISNLKLPVALNALEQMDVPVRVMTALPMQQVAEPYIRNKAVSHLEKGRTVIFGCGIGSPFFSTDTAAVLRAAEIDADVILLAKNIDGVYSADPKKDPNAVKYDAISYDEVLAQHLAVMDTTATSLSMDNKIPVLLFALKDPENILRVVMGERIGTIVGG